MRITVPKKILFVMFGFLLLSACSCGRRLTPQELAKQKAIELKLAKVKNFSQAVQLYCEGIDISEYNPKCVHLNILDYQSDLRQPILDVMMKTAISFFDWLRVWYYAPSDSSERQVAYSKIFETAKTHADWHALSFETDGRSRPLVRKNMFAKATTYDHWEINLSLFPERSQECLIEMSKRAKTRMQWKIICLDERARSGLKMRACEKCGGGKGCFIGPN